MIDTLRGVAASIVGFLVLLSCALFGASLAAATILWWYGG